MFERREEMKRWFYKVVARFREKGAVSPEKAMTIEELGLPLQFETAMNKHLGESGVFVAINGKYYISEEKLKQIEKPGSVESVFDSKRRILLLRTLQPIVIFLFLVLFIVGFLIQSSKLKVISILLLTVWLVISVYLIYYMSRLRRRMYSRTVPHQ